MSTTADKPVTTRPELVVLDVNETLSDLSGLRAAFRAAGLDERDLDAWFAGVLRDAFALTVLGENPSFADIASASLRARLHASGSTADPDAAAEQVMERFYQLQPHPDVVPGLLALAEAGCRIVTLSNGSAAVARALLADTDAGAVIEDHLSVADAGAWKPTRTAYAYAMEQTGVAGSRAMLVAAHPWDVEGARRAGLRTAWISRAGTVYPDHFGPADVSARSFVELASALTER